MALRIRLESKGVAGANLWGHLYLVLWDDALPYQDAYNSALVIRGGPLGSDLSIESDGFLLRDSIDRYDSGTPASERPQIDITDLIPGGSLGWANLEQVASELSGLYPYEYPFGLGREHVSNSNATILTVLSTVGIDVRDLLPLLQAQSPYVFYFPGATEENGTLLGVGTNEWIDASGMNDDIVLYGRDDFNDRFRGTDGDDYIYGRGGDDETFLTSGADVIYGDEGADTFNASESSQGVDLVVFSSLVDGQALVEGGAETGESSALTYSVEQFALSAHDDNVWITGSLELLFQADGVDAIGIDASASDRDGDTVVFETTVGATIDLEAESLTSDNGEIALLDFENVVGTLNADQITGDSEANILVGGEGVDTLVGGEGDDILVFDAEDGEHINGGAGRDTAYASGATGVDLNLTAAEIEIAIGGSGNDTIVSWQSGMIAGGDGNDLLRIAANAAEPAVVWGGEGQDVIDIISSGNGPVGIMTVSVDGLSSENFSQFSLDMLGLGSDFNWSEIDVVVLNPDSQDQVMINGDLQGATGVTREVTGVVMTDEGFEVLNSWTSYSYTGTLAADYNGQPTGSDFYVDNYHVGFLSGAGLISVQAGAAKIGVWMISEATDPNGITYVAPEDYELGEIVDFGSSDFSSTWVQMDDHRGRLHAWVTFEGYQNGETVYGWPTDIEGRGYAWGTPDWGQVSNYENFSDMQGPWFVYGGAFGGSKLSANGTLSTTMPSTDNTFSLSLWLAEVGVTNLSFDPGTTERVATSAANNFSFSSSGTASNSANRKTVIFSFDETEDTVEIDSIIVNPNQIAAGITLAQNEQNVEIAYGSGGSITLENVSLSDWQEATALTSITGTSGKEVLVGGAGDDVIDGLGDSDQLFGGDGNDTISDTSGNNSFYGEAGNDFLSGLGGNGHNVFFGGTGDDTMTGGGGRDRFYFTSGDGTDEIENFFLRDAIYIDGVLVAGPDNLPIGVTGSNGNNGYELLYGSGDLITLIGVSESELYDWAQLNITGTAGDDVIAGRSNEDTLSGASGNDTITGGKGRDILNGDAGGDVLDGGGDADTMHGGEGNDLLSDANGNNTYYGDAGNDTVVGGGGHENITGGTGDDSLVGGGGNDRFYFSIGDGNDIISDFNTSGDLIQFIGTGLSYGDLSIADSAGGVIVTYGVSDSILLEGHLAANLGMDDFIFA